jgi:putative transport protein
MLRRNCIVAGLSLEKVQHLALILFVYTIGLQVGPSFFSSLRRQGLQLNVLAAAVVVLGGLFPLVLVGFVARIVLKLDFATICGVLAGSMTDPPALAFAGTITKSDQPLVAYAAVYPLVMILRVFVVQILILTLPA